MHWYASRFLLIVGILVLSFQAAVAADIQMLPPTDPNNAGSPCDMTSTSNQLLIFNGGAPAGQSAINCNTKVTADPVTGNVGIGMTTPATSPLEVNGATTAGAFYYTGSSGLGGGPPPPPPTFTATCPPGQVLSGIASGSPVCAVLPSGGGIPDISCPVGQSIIGISGGVAVCGTGSGSGGAACGSVPDGYITTTFTSDFCAGASSVDWGWTTITQCQNGGIVSVAAPIHTGYCP